MSISTLVPRPGPGAGPGDVLTQVAAAVRALDETVWTDLSDGELVAVVEQLEIVRSAVGAVQAGAVAEAETRGLAKTRLHYGSTADWLTHTGGLRRGEGRRLVVRAQALTGPMASTREAMAAGRVSPEQADVIVRSVEDLPSGEAVRRHGEATLLDHAGSLDATGLATTGRHLVHVVDPGGTERRLERQLCREERASHKSRFLSVVSDGAGGVRVKGRGSAEDGAILKAALLPLTTPAPAVDDETGGRPVYDPRDHGARTWDALVGLAQHALDADLLPASHGAPARVTVAVALDALREGLAERGATDVAGLAGLAGAAVTGDGAELSAATVRRLACDAEIIPAVLGGQGEVLDVGRARRPVTLAIWATLVLRDQHCAFPGCHRPPIMCHAHHIVAWTAGGRTALDNLVLLCGHHHRTVHHSPWQARINRDDHKPEFRPPPKPGVPHEWIRHRPRRE